MAVFRRNLPIFVMISMAKFQKKIYGHSSQESLDNFFKEVIKLRAPGMGAEIGGESPLGTLTEGTPS